MIRRLAGDFVKNEVTQSPTTQALRRRVWIAETIARAHTPTSLALVLRLACHWRVPIQLQQPDGTVQRLTSSRQ